MKKKILFLTVIFLGISSIAQNVSIPDVAFKASLVANTFINANGDSEIQISEATAFSGTIYCVGEGVTDLTGLSAFTNITELNCVSNSITIINTYANTGLERLFCGNNQLTSIDVSANTSLTQLDCSDNSLTSLNVANGNNANFIYFQATSNPNLNCVQVDDAAYSTANWTNIDAGANFSLSCGAPACTVNIPDLNFKAYLVGQSLINTNNDTEIQCSEASAFTGVITCSNLSISDLTGIEAFVSLTELWCNNNTITSLDLSSNAGLLLLYCYANPLVGLNVSNNTNLEGLFCRNNNLTSLDLSNNISLKDFNCENNALTSLDLSINTNLEYFDCRINALTSLDVSNNADLIYFYCNDNELTSLNVANGNNASLVHMHATSNSTLACIQHDSGFDPTANSSWNKDSTAAWSDNCTGVNINENDFSFSVYPNPTSGLISINTDAGIETLVLTDINGRVLFNSTNANQIDLSSFRNGIFLLKVITQVGTTKTLKLVKE